MRLLLLLNILMLPAVALAIRRFQIVGNTGATGREFQGVIPQGGRRHSTGGIPDSDRPPRTQTGRRYSTGDISSDLERELDTYHPPARQPATVTGRRHSTGGLGSEYGDAGPAGTEEGAVGGEPYRGRRHSTGGFTAHSEDRFRTRHGLLGGMLPNRGDPVVLRTPDELPNDPRNPLRVAWCEYGPGTLRRYPDRIEVHNEAIRHLRKIGAFGFGRYTPMMTKYFARRGYDMRNCVFHPVTVEDCHRLFDEARRELESNDFNGITTPDVGQVARACREFSDITTKLYRTTVVRERLTVNQ